MSFTIAIAGGTGSLGRAIAEAILSTGTFRLIILSRKFDASIQESLGVPVIPVDYTRVDQVAKVLEEHNVHTLVSVVNPTPGPQTEFVLIEAAEKVPSTKRFIPSIWGIKYSKEHGHLFPLAQTKLEILDRLESSPLEWTAWYFGLYAEFLAQRPSPFPIILDLENHQAVVPGSGDVPITVASKPDVARFVTASLSLPSWRRETYLIGDKFTPNQAVEVAEGIRGTKFKVTHDSLDALKAGKATELPNQTVMSAFIPREALLGIVSFFMTLFESGALDFQDVDTINEEFPDLKPKSIKELMSEGWGRE
ncbi:NmrA-like family protein [Colletotrichum sojae]|uniref:NmrA-like family protein n=1 Tax=Colletotrichum sojae TaxID=2175907 RepID=A0A8H6IKF5_9PEZI|nr:NmrA-like family protein [Colletotrichum sojae]